MDDAVEITIVLDAEDARKLAEIAGGKARSGEYLADLIRMLYEEQQGRKGVDIEPTIKGMNMLLDRRESLKEQLKTVEARLEKLLSINNELTHKTPRVSQRLKTKRLHPLK
jgi:hypothetical protein